MAKNKPFITNAGIAYWPNLQKPDTKYDNKYKTGLLLHADDSKDLREAIHSAFVEKFGESKLKNAKLSFEKASEKDDKAKKTIQSLIDKTKDNKLENYYIFKFQTQHKPSLWDCSKPAQEIKEDINLRSGSIIQVQTSLNPYSYGNSIGVTCYFSMVRVIDPVTGSTSPFQDEVEGFVYQNDNAPSLDVAANGDF